MKYLASLMLLILLAGCQSVRELNTPTPVTEETTADIVPRDWEISTFIDKRTGSEHITIRIDDRAMLSLMFHGGEVVISVDNRYGRSLVIREDLQTILNLPPKR